MKKILRLTESDIHNMIKEAVNRVLQEEDRHREGYWKERWAKQKAAKQTKTEKDADAPTQPKKDRHRKGYYREYNKKHPERLNRGFTKGYNNGNVSDGVKPNSNGNIWYDQLGRPHSRDFFNPTLSDLLDYKCHSEWHDDDWCEDVD